MTALVQLFLIISAAGLGTVVALGLGHGGK